MAAGNLASITAILAYVSNIPLKVRPCVLGITLLQAANNVVSHSKRCGLWSSSNSYFDIVRSVQTAIQISFAGLGAIIGTVVFRAQDAPRFIPGESKGSSDPDRGLIRHIRPHCHPCVSGCPARGPVCDCVAFFSNEQTHERRQTGRASRRSTWVLLHSVSWRYTF